MAVTEESRYEVHKYFEETMGRERATTLMELLPPVGWGDVATKQDVLLLKEDIEQLRVATKQDLLALREWVSERTATKDDVHQMHTSLLRELRIYAISLVTLMGIGAVFIR